MAHKWFFLQKNKKRRIWYWFQICRQGFEKCPKKLWVENREKSFFCLHFLKTFLKAGINKKITINVSIFDTYFALFKESFLGYISTFCICAKNLTFSKILLKITTFKHWSSVTTVCVLTWGLPSACDQTLCERVPHKPRVSSSRATTN
jgi:hypothetical protein